MAETAGKRFNRMIHRWWLELDNACHVNPNLYRWWLDLVNACHVNPNLYRWWLYLDNACHVNPILYRWWLDLVYVGRLYQADNSKRRVRRLTHQFGTEWQNYINLILLKDNDKWRRNNITFVTNLFPYSPVLDLLHAHGDSPEERCSSRLVPFAIRTRFAPSVRKSAIPLFPLPKWQSAQNPCSIRLSAGGGGDKSTLTLLGVAKEIRCPPNVWIQRTNPHPNF